MSTNKIYYCDMNKEVCPSGCILCCRICPKNSQCENRCINRPGECGCSIYVANTGE